MSENRGVVIAEALNETGIGEKVEVGNGLVM